MANTDIHWVGAVTGNAGTAGNWSPAQVPVTTDQVFIGTDIASAVDIDAGLDTFNLFTAFDIAVGPLMTGSIGTAGLPLQVGTGTNLIYDGTNVPLANFDIQTCVQARIRSTGAQANALLLSAGTWSEILIESARNVILKSGITVTMARIFHRGNPLGDVSATIEAGITFAALEMSGGTIDCSTTPTSVTIAGGQFTLNGTAAATLTLLRMLGGTAMMRARSQTVTEIDGFGGVVDFRKSPAAALTAARIRSGCTLYANNSGNTITGAATKLGGNIQPGALTVTEDIPSLNT